jgi:hypothetical protein
MELPRLPKCLSGRPRAGDSDFSVYRATTADPSLDCRKHAEAMHKHRGGQWSGMLATVHQKS